MAPTPGLLLMPAVAEAVHRLERGSLIVLRSQWGGDDDECQGWHQQIAAYCGYDRFVIIVLAGDDQLSVVGPEGMREVLAAMASEQLAALAAGAVTA